MNHREVSRPDLGKEILLQGRFYEAEMDWEMIVGYDFMMETDSGVLPAQPSMTLYQDDQLSWLSSPEHHVECQWIHPARNQLEVAALGTEPTGPANQEYSVMLEVANRVVADLGASDLALDAFSSGTSAHLRVCEKYWSAQDSAWKKHSGPHHPLPPIGHPKGDSEDSQGPLQGGAGCSYGMHRGGKYPTLGSLIDQHELKQGRPTGWRECLSGR